MIRKLTVIVSILVFFLAGGPSPAEDYDSAGLSLQRQREVLGAFQWMVPRPYVIQLKPEEKVTHAKMIRFRRWASGNIDQDGNPLPDRKILFNRTAAEVPTAVVERVTSFFENVRMKQWSEAAGYVSRLSEALPFNPGLTGEASEYPMKKSVRGVGDEDREKLVRITMDPGDVFLWPAGGKGLLVDGEMVKGWRVTIPYICEESGWLVSFLEYDRVYSGTTAFYWIREEGEWRVLCDETYHPYLDFRPGCEIDLDLGEAVTGFEEAYSRAVTLSGFWGRDRHHYRKAWSYCSERFREVRGYKSLTQDYESGPEWNIPLTLRSLKFIRIAGFRVEGEEVRVLTESRGRILHHSECGTEPSVWIKESGQWRRDRY